MIDLSATLLALSHPVRRGVLARLQHGEVAVNELASSLRVSGPALTRHLHVLERAGLITRSRAAQRRPCRLRAQPLREMDAWMQSYRKFWVESADRLEDHLKAMQAKKREDAKRHDKRL
jgi:DNA-binding transcriptional ArsR family regulator